MKIKSLPIILQDSREKRPWNWDDDVDFETVITEKLDIGDYSIQGMQHIICIERKSSVDELYTNLFSRKNYERLCREMERFQNVKHRFIIIEEDLSRILDPNVYYVNKSGRNKRSPKMPPAVVINKLIEFMLNYDIHVIFAGNKGQSIAKKLLLRAYNDYK